MAGPTNRAYAVNETEIGIALETVVGTAPAQPTYMLPVKSPKYKPNQAVIPDETLQGNMAQVQDEVLGMRYDQHGWSAPPYMDSLPVLLCSLLGSPDTLITKPTNTTLSSAAVANAATISTTATIAQGAWFTVGSGATLETHKCASVSGSGPFVVTLNTPLVNAQANGATVAGLTGHQSSLLNNSAVGDQPPSFTIWDYDGEEWRTISACQVDELNFKGNATGLVEYTVSMMGNAGVQNASAPSTSYTGLQTPAPWTFGALLGSTFTPTITDWSLSLKRGTKPIPALTGTQSYLQFFAGPIQCTAKLTFVEQAGSPYLANYLNGTRQVFDFTIWDMLAGGAFNFHSTSAMFTTGELDRSKEYPQVPVTVQFLPTTTDATAGSRSPFSTTVANAVTTAYH